MVAVTACLLLSTCMLILNAWLQGIPLKDKGQTDSYQRIEAPVRGGEGAPGNIPDGGPPVTERQNSLDQLLIQNDQAQVCKSPTLLLLLVARPYTACIADCIYLCNLADCPCCPLLPCERCTCPLH